MNLVSDPAYSVSNCLENDNTSKPAVNKVHGVEGDAGELDDGVVATSKEEQWDHVDDSHDTGAAEEFTSTRGKGAVVDLPDTKANVDSEVANQEEALQTTGQGSNANSGRELELAVMTGAEQGRIEAVLFESCVGPVGNGEVSLGFVVEACYSTDVADEVEDDLVEEEDDDDDPPDVSKVVLNVDVF